MRRNLLYRFSSLLVLLFFVGVSQLSAQSYLSGPDAEMALQQEYENTVNEAANYDQLVSPALGFAETEFKMKLYYFTLSDLKMGADVSVVVDDLSARVSAFRTDYDPNGELNSTQVQAVQTELHGILTDQL